MKTTFGFWALIALAAPFAAHADALEGKRTAGEIIESAAPDDWLVLDQDDLLYIELDRGMVIVALSTNLAQGHVEQMRALAREKFYDGLSFYRVIDGFVAQGGDVLEKRSVEHAKETLPAEFDELMRDDILFAALPDADGYADRAGFVGSLPVGLDETENRIWHLHCTGAVAMARNVEKNTGGTEIYVTLQPQRYLDRNLSVFGRVVSGMEHLQALRRVAPAQSEEDDLGEEILSVRVGSDLLADEQTQLRILKAGTALFEEYVDARRNRRAAFFYHRPDYVDVCQLPVPVEPVPVASGTDGDPA